MDAELIQWKTDAWKAYDMVAAYAGRMHDQDGTIRLKNAVEVGLCRKYAIGHRLLDVGVGTGRAAIPLARDGYEVTGVDISDAMLEQCAREAKGLPVRLLHGDVAALPFRDERFDTIVALNVVLHFPHWQTILDEWRRFLAPGGRMVFDVHSRDHIVAVAASTGRTYENIIAHELADHRNFVLRLSAKELFAYARQNRLTVRAMVPYASIYNRLYWLDDHPLLSPALLERMVSWTSVYPELFDLNLAIEQDVFGALSPASTGRAMVVLEDVDDPATNDALEARFAQIDAAFARGIEPADLPMLFGEWLPALRAQLGRRFENETTRTFLAILLAGARSHAHLGGLFELIPEPAREMIRDLEERRIDDERASRLDARWAQEIPPAVRTFHGVDLAATLSYDLAEAFTQATAFDDPTKSRP